MTVANFLREVSVEIVAHIFARCDGPILNVFGLSSKLRSAEGGSKFLLRYVKGYP